MKNILLLMLNMIYCNIFVFLILLFLDNMLILNIMLANNIFLLILGVLFLYMLMFFYIVFFEMCLMHFRNIIGIYLGFHLFFLLNVNRTLMIDYHFELFQCLMNYPLSI